MYVINNKTIGVTFVNPLEVWITILCIDHVELPFLFNQFLVSIAVHSICPVCLCNKQFRATCVSHKSYLRS